MGVRSGWSRKRSTLRSISWTIIIVIFKCTGKFDYKCHVLISSGILIRSCPLSHLTPAGSYHLSCSSSYSSLQPPIDILNNISNLRFLRASFSFSRPDLAFPSELPLPHHSPHQYSARSVELSPVLIRDPVHHNPGQLSPPPPPRGSLGTPLPQSSTIDYRV